VSVKKRDQKEKAQEMLMYGIGVVLGYWTEQSPDAAKDMGITDEELDAILWREADRVARLFGYEKAWAQ
jgi:predicted TIM-barrel fold metal-dependent hydrolase